MACPCIYTHAILKAENFRKFIFSFAKAKFPSIAVATVGNFNEGKGKKKDIKTRVLKWQEYKVIFCLYTLLLAPYVIVSYRIPPQGFFGFVPEKT